MRSPRLSLLTLSCLAAGGASAFSQVAAGAITGVVRDASGRAVPGATVTMTNVETSRQRIVTSTLDGVYSAPSLPPGQYRLTVELAGFKTVRRAGVQLTTGATARIDFDLAVGDMQEQVTVTADASVLRPETGSLGTLVAHEQVGQLPLNGRTFITLASLAPGVAFDASILTGPIANYPVADNFNRALERDYSTGDMPHVFVSSVVWDLPAGRGPPVS
jgi:hypothetical protein